MQGGKTLQDLIREKEDAEQIQQFVQEEEKNRQAELERQREQRRNMMASAFNRNKTQQQQQQQIEKEQQQKMPQVTQEDLRKQRKQEQQREQRRQMMQQAYDKDRLAAVQLFIDDSSSLSQPAAEVQRVINKSQQEALNQRANLFKNRQQQMQEDICKEEQSIQRMKQYEDEAMQEIIEEKKAEVRAKTINIYQKMEQQKFEQAVDESNKVVEVDSSINDHQLWLLQRLYSQRDATGDFAFTFPNQGNQQMIKCHSHILRSKSPYFDGLFKFTEARQNQFTIEQYSYGTFKAMIEYFYTGKCEIDSNDIIEFLEMCQEYMLPDLKQLIEQIMITNIDQDNFIDNLQVARAFECKILKEALYLYGKKNYQELYRKGIIKNLTKEEFLIVKPQKI